MTTPGEAIAITLEQHRFRGTNCCDCGFIALLSPWNRNVESHIAEAITTALGLVPEYTWTWDRDAGKSEQPRPGYGFSCDTHKEARTEADDYMTIVTRHVTPWTPIEKQP